MPAYSFQKQFAEPIIAGTKGGTIRATRGGRWSVSLCGASRPGGHARPGEPLYLFTGMRTKHCRKIAEKPCLATQPISLYFGRHPRIEVHGAAGAMVAFYTSQAQRDRFAVFDGFEGWTAMAMFWAKTHDAIAIFDGWHIRWLELPAS